MKYSIKLENFEGPLELLLHLVEIKEMSIYEVKISQIIDEYLDLMLDLKENDVHVKLEFLVMATELLEIKALSILKDREKEKEEKEKVLEQKLIEYKEVKDLSRELAKLENEYNFSYKRDGRAIKLDDYREIDLSTLSKEMIFDTYYSILEKNSIEEELEIKIDERYSMSEEMEYIKNKLTELRKADYLSMFQEAKSRLHVVYIFLAILELYRDKLVDFDNEQIILEGSY